MRLPVFATLSLITIIFTAAHAEEPKPSYKDIAYDDQDPAQVLDVYLAESDQALPAMIYFHGGGWEAGSKSRVPAWLQRGVRENRFSVVAVEYRFTQVAPHPAQTNDCLRAIQFTRQHSKKWNIDPSRLCATGGSAGGHLSLYVALHDDVASPKATDPVQRESSRVACAVGFAGPTDWNLLSELEHNHPAYRKLIGHEPGTSFKNMDADRMKAVSPLSFVSEDDPPIMIVHGGADTIVPVQHAHRLHKQLESVGVKTELVVVDGAGHAIAGAGGAATQSPPFIKRAEAFVEQVFSTAP